MATLEDIYLPYRPKRRTRATMAREKGLEPLAKVLFAQEGGTDPLQEAVAFIDDEQGVGSMEDALAGARDIIAEWVNEDAAGTAGHAGTLRDRGLSRVQSGEGQGRGGGKIPRLFRLAGAGIQGTQPPGPGHVPRRERGAC